MPGMLALELPDHGVKLKQGPDGERIFDPYRRKWVMLTPEEWVRQHFLAHLVHDLGCPETLIRVEQSLSLNGLAKRADATVYDRHGDPLALVECKGPGVKLTQAVFDQASRYNIGLRVRWLFVTNGMKHYCCEVDLVKGKVRFHDKLPSYAVMIEEVGGGN